MEDILAYNNHDMNFDSPRPISEDTYQRIYGERDATTEFMRSIDITPGLLAILQNDLLGKMKSRLSIAIAGSSYGQEVYSYALLCQTFGYQDYIVDGYDVHSNRIEMSKLGVYPPEYAERLEHDKSIDHSLFNIAMKKVSGFKRTVLVIDQKVRDNTHFYKLDFSVDPFPKHYDMIVCTNVLGQEQRGGRDRASKHLIDAVHDGGLLVTNCLVATALLPASGILRKKGSNVEKFSYTQ